MQHHTSDHKKETNHEEDFVLIAGEEQYIYFPNNPEVVRSEGLVFAVYADYDTGNQIGYVVLVNTRYSDCRRHYMYHAYGIASAKLALSMAIDAQKTLPMHLAAARSEARRRKIEAFVRANPNIFVTKTDALEAGFCPWGIKLFWNRFMLPMFMTTGEALSVCQRHEDESCTVYGFWVVLHSIYLKNR